MPSACTAVNLTSSLRKPSACQCLGKPQEGAMLRVIHFETHADETKCAIRFYHSMFG